MIVQKPIEGLMLAKNDLQEKARIAALPKRKKKARINIPADNVSEKTPKCYEVNKKEVSHRIRNYVNQMKGEKKLYFWTITFPLDTSDNHAFLCYNKWLTRLRKEKMLRSYIWVSERQKNGTIHFHIAVNQRICVKRANKYMRACIMTLINDGLITVTREEAKNYNGVDIAKNRKTRRVTNFAQKKNEKSLVNYLTKYVTKNTEVFNHLAWHCSRDYSNLIICVRLTDSEYSRSGITNLLSKKPTFETEWFAFYKWENKVPPEVPNYLSMVNNIVLELLEKN
jgi:hypothetical protein